MVVIQQTRYPVFYDGNTSIQLSLLWQNLTPVRHILLKPLLKTIKVISLKPQVFPIVLTYIASLIINKDKLLLNSISSVQ